jgi:hypothetical protein
MFTRDEASRTKQEFWTVFGKYMSPVLATQGKVNWINYHTGLKDVYFRMETGNKSAAIYISIEHNDREIQQMYFEQFLELKSLLHDALDENWDWQLHVSDEHGKVVSRIYKETLGVSVFNREHWPELISFFKPRIIALDAFWEDARYSFEALK